MIYWTKKNTKKNSFKEISKDFIKNDFKLMISIYLFTKKKKRINLFSQFHLYSILKKVSTLIVSGEFIKKFKFGHKIYFLLAFTRK